FAAGDNLDRQELGHGLFARATHAIGASTEAGMLHLGVGAGVDWRRDGLRVRGRPDVSGLPLLIVDSGMIDRVDRIDRLALEAAWDHGPWTLQAEYARLRARPAALPASDAASDGDGAYVMASWRPGGQSRGYRDGLFRTVSNANPGGAFELVARLSYLSVRGADGARRSGHSAALGGNWNIGRDWRLQAQVSSSP